MKYLVLVLPIFAWAQQPYYNFDFETSTRAQAWGWPGFGSSYSFSVDTSTFVSGVQSYRMQSVATGPALATTVQNFPVSVAAGHRVRYSGYIKTQGNISGHAAL